MTLRTTVILLCAPLAISCAEPERDGVVSGRSLAQQAASAEPVSGKAYQHRISSSHFPLTSSAKTVRRGTTEFITDAVGVFSTNLLTTASLAVRSTVPLDKLPKPFTRDSGVHNGLVREYFSRAGFPMEEVSGMHVTTAMRGGGPAGDQSAYSKAELLWYTSHLERSVAGIPVEGSFAFAAFDDSGAIITEGVYWPAIPADVVTEAVAFARQIASDDGLAAFLEPITRERELHPEHKGELRIVHTTSTYEGGFVAIPLYVAFGNRGGKVPVWRFDRTGIARKLPDEVSTIAPAMRR